MVQFIPVINRDELDDDDYYDVLDDDNDGDDGDHDDGEGGLCSYINKILLPITQYVLYFDNQKSYNIIHVYI